MPGVATYFVLPAWRAAAHASLMCWGVSKSGSPAAKLQTSWPAAMRAFAFESTASVGEGEMFRAQVESCGRVSVGIVCKGAHKKGPWAPNARRYVPRDPGTF